MRIELILNNLRPTRIPINYNYSLASCIYNTLGSSSGDYANRLHEHGYEFKGKHFKLFTFSQLLAPRCRALGDQLLIRADTIRWLISSPVDEFIIHFANGILDHGQVRINEASFPVREVRTVAEPKFSERMPFRCLSPITVSTHTDAEGLNRLQYCRLEDGFYEKVADNLRRKQALLESVICGGGIPAAPGNRGYPTTFHSARSEETLSSGGASFSLTAVSSSHSSSFTPHPCPWKMEFDPVVIASRQGRIHKLITYKDTKIFCYHCPFTVEGSPELMRVGYQSGFGDGNSKGFGMVEVDNS